MKKQKIVQIRGFNCLIDESIVPYIQWLNKNGFHTIGCCSGDPYDHDCDPNSPGIEFFTEIISTEHLILLIKTALETKLDFNYHSVKFPYVENNIKCENVFSIGWKTPDNIYNFMCKLEQNSKTKM